MTDIPSPDQIDDLAHASRSVVNKMGVHALWKAVLALPEWYFVGSQADPNDPDSLEPIIAAVEGTPRLIAFTDENRAEAFGKARARAKGSDGAVLSMDVPSAIEYGMSIVKSGPAGSKVAGFLFNTGEYAFQASFEDVRNYHKQWMR